MPSRVIRGEINSSESLSLVSPEAELVFRALLLAVDDYGRVDARPEVLKGLLFPLRRAFTSEKIARWIKELAAIEDPPIGLYEVGGRPYLWLVKWELHRSAGRRGDRSKCPEPPGGTSLPAQDAIVYFVRSGESGPIKIGWSGSPASRFDSLRTAVPDLRILGVVPSETRALEKKLHRLFAEFRSSGEWFNACESLLQWISDNCVQWCPGTAQDVPLPPARLTSYEGRVARDEGRVANTRAARGVKVECPEALSEPEQEALVAWCREKHPDLVSMLPEIWGQVVIWARAHGHRRASWYATAQTFVNRRATEGNHGPIRSGPSNGRRLTAVEAGRKIVADFERRSSRESEDVRETIHVVPVRGESGF